MMNWCMVSPVNPESAAVVAREESIFHAARQLPDPAARSAFLDAVCGDEPELRGRLEALLATGGEGNDLFAGAASGARPGPFGPLDGRLGDYELIEEIGRGGMGMVYRARQLSTQRMVALKVIRAGAGATSDQVRRFQVEAEAAAQLQHPNIVRVHGSGSCEGSHYLCMDLMDGKVLATEMRKWDGSKRSASSDSEAFLYPFFGLSQFCAIGRAVQYAHDRGVLHRDLKPANILLDAAGAPHLFDFGLAKMLDRDGALTRTAEVMGTPGYMAPEQARGGGSSVATDVYGLGTILYQCITGSPPFAAATPVETLRQVIEQDPVNPAELNSAVDPVMALICLRCLEKDPRHRYATAAELIADLERWQRREPILARSLSLGSRVARWARRNPVGTALIASLCLGLGVTLALLQQVNREKNKQAALAVELRIANQESTRLLARAVGMVRENLENLWASEERRSMLVGSEEIAALANRPVAPLPARAGVVRYTLGLTAEALPSSRAQQHAELLAYLEERLGADLVQPVRIDVRFYKFVVDCRDDLCAGRLDFARIGALPYLQARQRVPGLQPIAVPVTPPKVAVFFTQAGSGLRSLADLRGRRVAFGETNSTVSFRSQMELAQRGLGGTNLAGYDFLDASLEFAEEVREMGVDEALKRIGYLHSHAPVIEGVLQGRYDAGVAAFRAFQINHSRGLAAIPDSEFVVGRKIWVARAGLSAHALEHLRRAMTDLRGQPWLAILPDCPSGYELVTDETYAVERGWLERVRTVFPSKAASASVGNSGASGN